MKKRMLSVLLIYTMVLSLLTVFPITTRAEVDSSIITTVSATVPTPIIGKTISKTDECLTNTVGIQITDMNWTTGNGSVYPDGTVFQEGVTYYCDMEFWVEDGYTFPDNRADLEGYINEILGEVSSVYYTDHAYVVVAFTPTKAGDVYVSGVGMTNGDYLPTGSTTTTKQAPNNGYAYYNNGILTLHNYSCGGIGLVLPTGLCEYGALIYSENDLTVKLEGINYLTTAHDILEMVGIWSNYSCNIDSNSDATLNISVNCVGIYTTDSLSIHGCHISIIAEDFGLESDEIKIQNAGLVITSKEESIYGSDSVFLGNATADLTSLNEDGIHSGGSVTLNQCKLIADAGDSGIEAWGGKLGIYESEVTIQAQYGLYNEEHDLVISESAVDIIAENYGIASYKGSILISESNLDVISTYNGEVDEDCSALLSTDCIILIDIDSIVRASTEPDGLLGEYNPENIKTYDHIVIRKALYGDVDENGKVEATDALEVLKSVVGKVTLTDRQKNVADVDDNGKVDATDALEILKHVVGKPSAIG